MPGTHQPIIEQDQWQRVQTLLNTTATELLTDANGAVVGVKATGSTGETITVNAKAVSVHAVIGKAVGIWAVSSCTVVSTGTTRNHCAPWQPNQ